MDAILNVSGPGGSRRRRYPNYLWKHPRMTVAPSITGTRTVGQTLTLSGPGTWVANPSVSAYTYQWLEDNVPIAGATGLTRVLATPQGGKVVSVRITATNSRSSRSRVISAGLVAAA